MITENSKEIKDRYYVASCSTPEKNSVCSSSQNVERIDSKGGETPQSSAYGNASSTSLKKLDFGQASQSHTVKGPTAGVAKRFKISHTSLCGTNLMEDETQEIIEEQDENNQTESDLKDVTDSSGSISESTNSLRTETDLDSSECDDQGAFKRKIGLTGELSN